MVSEAIAANLDNLDRRPVNDVSGVPDHFILEINRTPPGTCKGVDPRSCFITGTGTSKTRRPLPF